MPPFVRRCRRLSAWAGMLSITLVVLAVEPGRSTQQPAGADSGKSAANKPTELHRLKNEDLLKQAVGIYDKAEQEYRAALRALAAAELLLEETTKAAEPPPNPKSSGPPPDPVGKKLTAEGKAQAAVDLAKEKRIVARQRLKLVQARQELLDRVSIRVEAISSASLAFLQALDDVKSFTLEIELRAKDGSLTRDKIPPDLLPGALEKKRKELAAEKDRWKQKIADAPTIRREQSKLLSEANQGVSAAESEVAQAGKTLTHEHQRAELELAYSKKSVDEMLADLTGLVDEWEGLTGTRELSLARFNESGTRRAKLRDAIIALKQPELKLRPITRAEDVEVASRMIQEQINYYSARTKALEDLRDILILHAQHGEEYEADAEVSDDHLFKMTVFGDLLKKAKVAEDKLPEQGRAKYLAAADVSLHKSVVEVHTAIVKAKSDLVIVEKRVVEARQAEEVAIKQLANLRQSQGVTTISLKYEEQFKGMSAAQLAEVFAKTRAALAAKQVALASDQTQYKNATAIAKEARAKLDAVKDTGLRQAEEEGQAERLRITRELRKAAGLDPNAGDARTSAPGLPSSPPQGSAKEATNGVKKNTPEKEPEPDKRTELEKLTERLADFQQQIAGKLRVVDEREEKSKVLLIALNEKEKKAAAFNNSLAEARQLALQLNAAAAELKKRVGKGQLASDKVPDGVTDALRFEVRTKLDADTAHVLTALEQIRREREKLLRPDAGTDTLKQAARELLALVGQRLDLLADLKKLTADYRREKKDLSPSEVKQGEQRAADRMSADGPAIDWLLGIDRSKKAKTLEELLEAYYVELNEIDAKDDNLKRQKEAVTRLGDLAGKELAALAKVVPVLGQHIARLQTAQEEELVLARARLLPDQADELLKAFRAKTGRLLAKPVPVRDTEKAEQVAELAEAIFEPLVQKEAAARWQEILATRLSATGIKIETGIYQDTLAQLNATAAANARRVAVLTGVEAPDPGNALASAVAKQPVVGGEITRTRQELTAIRIDGVRTIGYKIGLIVLAAFLLPRLLLLPFQRSVTSEGSGLLLSALRAFLKLGAWMTAFAFTLSVLGFDVTAIVAGLGIGGLAIGLAAQTMLADMIAAAVIFAEGKFKIGDVIKLGDDEPAKVIGLSWRSTQLRNTVGLVVHIPNRQVTDKPVQNLTKAGKIFDVLEVTVTTEREVSKVLAVVRQALEECKYLTGPHGVSINEFNQKGDTKIVKYRFWWFVEEYEGRDTTRDAVFTRISRSLDDEDLKGTEVSLA